MKRPRTNKQRHGRKTPTRISTLTDARAAVERAIVLIDTACVVAGDENLMEPTNERQLRLRAAIAQHDTALIFDSLMEAFSLQGISDHVAYTYLEQHGSVQWTQLKEALANRTTCPKLRSYWQMHACGYVKGRNACNEPDHFRQCSLHQHDLRNGRLNQTAYSLYLFIRDVADNDIIGWISDQLSKAHKGPQQDKVTRMRVALIDPMRNIFGVSDKVLGMALADLLMTAPREKKHWFETGASMIAVDTLVHNFLHRTGVLRCFGVHHSYGPACYRAGGCAHVIARVAAHIDARHFNPRYPEIFPRFVQHAIWRFCAQQQLDICNGNRIQDQQRCANKGCPLFHLCDRVALRKPNAASR